MLGFQISILGVGGSFCSCCEEKKKKKTGLLSLLQKDNYFYIILLSSNLDYSIFKQKFTLKGLKLLFVCVVKHLETLSESYLFK